VRWMADFMKRLWNLQLFFTNGLLAKRLNNWGVGTLVPLAESFRQRISLSIGVTRVTAWIYDLTNNVCSNIFMKQSPL
jgi:hypothetical protein